MSLVYYNEWEPYAAQWIRNLIAAGHLPAGEVDERSITEVHPSDLVGFDRCHFFAGIGGWGLALQWAGWDGPVWTGSCPCQPFSAAGKGNGFDDPRHLWPEWFRLIRECNPAIVFGEQVDAAVRRGWIDLVSSDLEGIGYAFGAADLPAASVGAPHIRQRLWWVAHHHHPGLEVIGKQPARSECKAVERGGAIGSLGNSYQERFDQHAQLHGSSEQQQIETPRGTNVSGPGGWSDLEWLDCRDGKARPTQPGLFPLAHGVPGRVGRLRAYGNAIVPQVAAEFVRAVMECRP